MDQPGKVANPPHGQLNKDKKIFRCPRSRLRFWCLLSPLIMLNLVLTLTGFLPISAAASFYLNRHTPSGQSRDYRVTRLRTDCVRCRESGTRPVVLKVVPVTGASLSSITIDRPINVRLSFLTPTIGMKWAFSNRKCA